jgi:hypothetical protein
MVGMAGIVGRIRRDLWGVLEVKQIKRRSAQVLLKELILLVYSLR